MSKFIIKTILIVVLSRKGKPMPHSTPQLSATADIFNSNEKQGLEEGEEENEATLCHTQCDG